MFARIYVSLCWIGTLFNFSQCKKGQTPLHLAALSGRNKRTQTLLQHSKKFHVFLCFIKDDVIWNSKDDVIWNNSTQQFAMQIVAEPIKSHVNVTSFALRIVSKNCSLYYRIKCLFAFRIWRFTLFLVNIQVLSWAAHILPKCYQLS